MSNRVEHQVSSFELLLQGKLKQEVQTLAILRAGVLCPQCGKGQLQYNGVLALECPLCGYTHGDCGGCT